MQGAVQKDQVPARPRQSRAKVIADELEGTELSRCQKAAAILLSRWDTIKPPYSCL